MVSRGGFAPRDVRWLCVKQKLHVVELRWPWARNGGLADTGTEFEEWSDIQQSCLAQEMTMSRNIVMAVLVSTMVPMLAHAGGYNRVYKSPEKRAEETVLEKLKSDITLKTTKVSEGVCGGQGPDYVVEVQLNRYERALDKSGQPTLVKKTEVIKTYAVGQQDLGTDRVMDSETCME